MSTRDFYVFLFACTFTMCLLSGPAQAELAVGDDVSFEMDGSDGKTYNSADFKGKKAIVIAWYPKAFTGG